MCIMDTVQYTLPPPSLVERNMVEKLDFSDEAEWDTKTLASAVKSYLM